MILMACLFYVLDDSEDAMCMLNHIAGTIASMHTPTDTLVTCMAELLLGHHDVPMLLGFINDMLMSTYP
jgi:hypothetical protein